MKLDYAGPALVPIPLKEWQALERQRDDLLAMLEELEWSAGDWKDLGYCPRCGRHRSRGHTDDCPLGNLIARAKGEGT